MSVEQLESQIRALSPEARRQFAVWFDHHRHELVEEGKSELSGEQTAELFRRRREYEEHPERFSRRDTESLDRLFSRVRENVAARFSSAR
jgi:hypothetical protein